MVVAAPPEPPLAASPGLAPSPVVDQHMEVESEGCACGPSGSRRKFDWCGPLAELSASLVVWWREAAGVGEAETMALRCG